MLIDRITIFCFEASYGVALVLEVVAMFRTRPLWPLLPVAFGGAGLLAHTLYLAAQRIALTSQSGSLLFLGWILAVFYVYGAVHHRRVAWGVFVLPVVLVVTVLAELLHRAYPPTSIQPVSATTLDHIWRILHIACFTLASVGACVAFMASVMYLIQAHRLKAKTSPSQGIPLLNLERLEKMNRRGINWAFPLLTTGLLIGFRQLLQADTRIQSWADPRVVSTSVLWLILVFVLYLRYGLHLRGRRLAILSIMAFALLMISMATTHSLSPGGVP